MESMDLVYAEGKVTEIGKHIEAGDRLIQGIVIQEDSREAIGLDLTIEDTRKCAELLFRRVRVTMRIEVIE